MPTWVWIVLGVALWTCGGLLLALALGRIISFADQQEGPDA